jgi:hypothetical protein
MFITDKRDKDRDGRDREADRKDDFGRAERPAAAKAAPQSKAAILAAKQERLALVKRLTGQGGDSDDENTTTRVPKLVSLPSMKHLSTMS